MPNGGFHTSLDREFLEEFFDGDIPYMIEIFDLFLQEMPSEITELNKFWQESDIQNIRKTVHRLKPSFKMVGRSDISDILFNIQMKIDRGAKLTECEDDLIHFFEESSKLLPILTAEIKRLKS